MQGVGQNSLLLVEQKACEVACTILASEPRVKVFLFGSRATGRAGSRSDIDLGIDLGRARLAEALRIRGPDNLLSEPIFIDNPVALKRRGIELRLVYTAPDAQSASKDQNLIDLVRRGWSAWQQLVTGPRSDNPVERSHIVRSRGCASSRPISQLRFSKDASRSS